MTLLTLWVIMWPIILGNAGIPMIFLTFPVMLIALIPIILIETRLLKKWLEISYKKSIFAFGLANIITTVIGFPLSWWILLWFQYVTNGLGCGPGYGNIVTSIVTVLVEAARACSHWGIWFRMIPIAFIISLIVAYFISVWIEYLIVKKLLKSHDSEKIKKIVVLANRTTYWILIILSLIFMIFTIIFPEF